VTLAGCPDVGKPPECLLFIKEGQDVPQFKLLASFDLPPQTRAKIERGNASRLLGLTL